MASVAPNLEYKPYQGGSYPQASEYKPTYDEATNTVTMRTGYSRREKLGSPYAFSEVVIESPDCIVVQVRFGGRDHWGTQEYYLVKDRKGWRFSRGNAKQAQPFCTEMKVREIAHRGGLKVWAWIP